MVEIAQNHPSDTPAFLGRAAGGELGGEVEGAVKVFPLPRF